MVKSKMIQMLAVAMTSAMCLSAAPVFAQSTVTYQAYSEMSKATGMSDKVNAHSSIRNTNTAAGAAGLDIADAAAVHADCVKAAQAANADSNICAGVAARVAAMERAARL